RLGAPESLPAPSARPEAEPHGKLKITPIWLGVSDHPFRLFAPVSFAKSWKRGTLKISLMKFFNRAKTAR
ncbi:hypothetical protein ACE1BS_19250, partial [Aeromonas jandaei]